MVNKAAGKMPALRGARRAKIKSRFLSARANAFTGSEREEKAVGSLRWE
jgi:hypothetical protein